MPEGIWEHLPRKRVKDLKDSPAVLDVVTIHVPSTAETKDLINLERTKGVKTNSVLINTARGGIMKKEGLVVAILPGVKGMLAMTALSKSIYSRIGIKSCGSVPICSACRTSAQLQHRRLRRGNMLSCLRADRGGDSSFSTTNKSNG